jgi:hypothetical protein
MKQANSSPLQEFNTPKPMKRQIDSSAQQSATATPSYMLPLKRRKTTQTTISQHTSQSSANPIDHNLSEPKPNYLTHADTPAPYEDSDSAAHAAISDMSISAASIQTQQWSNIDKADTPILTVETVVTDTTAVHVYEDYKLTDDAILQADPEDLSLKQETEEMSPEGLLNSGYYCDPGSHVVQVPMQFVDHAINESYSIPSTPVLQFQVDDETEAMENGVEADYSYEQCPYPTDITAGAESEVQHIPSVEENDAANVIDHDLELALRDSIRTHGEEEAQMQMLEENRRINKNLDQWLAAVSNVDDPELNQPPNNGEQHHHSSPFDCSKN